MPTSRIARILLIDDIEMNNTISAFTIRKLYPDVEVVSFTQPEEGLAYIRNEYEHNEVPTVLLLDINMPGLNGWEVLAVLAAYDQVLTRNLTIYMLSSSIDPRDKRRAAEAPNVSGFLERPLSAAILQEFLGDRVAGAV